jgi:hypothetical protein
MRPSLNALQQDFQDYLLGSEIEQPSILPEIQAGYGLPAPERLAIYYHAYRLRIRDALSDAFDKTHRYIGDELFYELCYAYIAAYPSGYRNLRWYGAQFPDFLAERLSEHPLVGELGRFEWHLSLAFDAQDKPVLVPDDLRALQASDWESLGFSCQASLHVLALRSNAVAVWLALGEEQEPPQAEVNDTPVNWLVWRKGLQPHFRSATQAEKLALQGLRDGKSFSMVCADAAAGEADNTTQIAGWLQSWLKDEILSGIRP